MSKFNQVKMRKFHQYLGYALMLPIVTWMLTGLFFFFKPGYSTAYQALSIKTNPIEHWPDIPVKTDWKQVKVIQSILGRHVIVQTDDGWQHLDEGFTINQKEPSEAEIRSLINDAIASNPERYGAIASIDGHKILTSTDVEISLNWPQMTLRQNGPDTRFINLIYDIHYLRWTGNKVIDQYLGVIGLVSLVLLGILGIVMAQRRSIRRVL